MIFSLPLPLTSLSIVVLGALTRQSTHDGIPIASLNKELVDIRKSREDVGCNCKQIKLDKLNVNKLRQALIAYQETIQPSSSLPSSGQDSSSTAENQQQGQFYEILSSKQIDSLSKSELINRLRGIYKSCPLCVINDCACVISGVGCHSNVCCCFRAGGVKHNCENPEGYRIYNADAVKEYRKGYLTAVSIVPNASSTSSATKSVNASVRSRAYST